MSVFCWSRFLDSYYEYLFKDWQYTGHTQSLLMFLDSYYAALRALKSGPWYLEAQMHNGKPAWAHFSSLQGAVLATPAVAVSLVLTQGVTVLCRAGFFPGMQTVFGDVSLAAHSAAAFGQLWQAFGFLPERFDLQAGEVVDGHVTKSTWLPLLVHSGRFLFAAQGTIACVCGTLLLIITGSLPAAPRACREPVLLVHGDPGPRMATRSA